MNTENPKADLDYGLASRRLYWLTAAIGIVGSCSGLAWWGKRVAGGFALGSAASLANLWIWHLVADIVGGKPGRRSKLAGALFAGRFLALLVFGYVIVETLNVQPAAAVFGLLASSAAVIVEILIELVQGPLRTR